MFEINETEDMSDIEYVAEFMATYPDQAALINNEQFPAFYQYPKLVMKQFRAAVQFMQDLQIPEEVIASEFGFYLNQACQEVSDLKANESENS